MLRVVGIGPGDFRYITQEGKTVLENSKIIYGHKRQLKILDTINNKGKGIEYTKLDELKGLLACADFKNQNVCILASGEPSLYGIAKYINDHFSEEGEDIIEVVPGISSVQYLFAKTKIPMNEVYITSCHGKDIDIEKIQSMDTIAFLTDQDRGPGYIADTFLFIGEDPTMVIGENLSYENEQITICKTSELDRNKTYEMSVVIILKDGSYER